MNTDQAVKEILSRSFDVYTQKSKENKDSSKEYIAIREYMTFVEEKDHMECVDIDRKVIEVDEIEQVFVKSFEQLRQQKRKAVYGMTKKQELIKVIYDTEVGFILSVGKSLYLQFHCPKDVSKEFCQLLY